MPGIFARALRHFLDLAGLMEGHTNEKIIDTVGVSVRTLERWLWEENVPHRTSWESFESGIRKRFQNNRAVLDALTDLKNAWQDAYRLTHRYREILAVAEAPQPRASSLTGLHESRHTADFSGILYRNFLADTRIAAQLPVASGLRSVFLDDVYVHRIRQETDVLKVAREYATSNPKIGRWLSIEGEAGQGKTSVLWFLAQEIRRFCPPVFPLQALQLHGGSLEPLIESLPANNSPFVVILDTLDLLVGIDDPRLAASLNGVRAKGGLLITTSRRQEIQTIARYVRKDQTINLDRYEPDEAAAAINRYVDASYPEWRQWQRDAQVEHVWNLLDSRRKVRDLSLDPLLLRMIFEAYVPNRIQPDINTQQVYDYFWKERVLGDRVSKTVEQALARSTLCLLLASYLYFEAGFHSERAAIREFINHSESQGKFKPVPVLEGLVSSGVLRWWQQGASVGFFHQTFLEYAAARSIMELDDEATRQRHIEELLVAVEGADLFRVPVLKQLMVQASSMDARLFASLCESVTNIENPVAARLALEVLGKAHDISDLHSLVIDWNSRSPKLIRAVAIEVMRYFPAARVPLALEILAPHVGEEIGMICATCADFFAPVGPVSTRRFLMEAWQKAPGACREFGGDLKNALVAIFRSGDPGVLDELAEILPSLSIGTQAGALNDLAPFWTLENAAKGAEFLLAMFVPLTKHDSNEARGAYVAAFEALHTTNANAACRIAKELLTEAGAQTDQNTILFLARLTGIADPTPEVIEAAFDDLLGPDHVRKIRAAYLLREAAKTRNGIVDHLLSLPLKVVQGKETVNAIYTIASGSKDAGRIFAVLERWDPSERGAGNPYRALLASAAKADPRRALSWLRARISGTESSAQRRQLLVGFLAVAETAAKSIAPADARRFWEIGAINKGATDETRRVAATTAGWIGDIDDALAREMFRQIFASKNRHIINAAIGSLRYAGSPELVLSVFELTQIYAAQQKGQASFGHFLEVVADRALDLRVALLRRLAAPDMFAFLKTLHAPVVISHVLTLLKSTAQADVGLVLELAAVCPLIDDSNRAQLSAILDNASRQTGDADLARRILSQLLDLAVIPSDRIRSSLRRALPHLETILPHREVAETVLANILGSGEWPEKAQEQLARAAKDLAGWTQQDSEEVLRSQLPPRVRSILLR